MQQNALADHLEISKSYLSEIESGKKIPSMELVEKYSKQFDIPASSILFFSEKLDDKDSSEGAEKTRGVIARKILNFLKVVETRTQ
jgi:transcriptional regulator with XRE-family HTH domain